MPVAIYVFSITIILEIRRVASLPRATIKSPVANGSKVPAWPILTFSLITLLRYLMQPNEVMSTGLLINKKPGLTILTELHSTIALKSVMTTSSRWTEPASIRRFASDDVFTAPNVLSSSTIHTGFANPSGKATCSACE